VYSSGKEAIERLRSGQPFDIVFCDLMMPEVSGIEVYNQVARDVSDLGTKFVFMTGGAFTAPAREFLETTPLLCLEKPFELGQVRELVAERIEA
jgi:CheY-like chemotaxis protein